MSIKLVLRSVLILALLSSSAAWGVFAEWSAIATTPAGTPLEGYTVTVLNYPSGSLATIYSDGVGTPQVNPFTTSEVDGSYSFWTNADGDYKIVISHQFGIYQTHYYNVTGSTITTLAVGGNVLGAAGSVDDTIVRFLGTDGKTLDTTGVTIDNSDNMVIPSGSSLTTEVVQSATTLDLTGGTDEQVTLAATGTSGVVVISGPAAISISSATGFVRSSKWFQVTGTATPPATCNATNKGSIYYDNDFNKFCYCNSSAWVQMDDSTTGCS